MVSKTNKDAGLMLIEVSVIFFRIFGVILRK